MFALNQRPNRLFAILKLGFVFWATCGFYSSALADPADHQYHGKCYLSVDRKIYMNGKCYMDVVGRGPGSEDGQLIIFGRIDGRLDIAVYIDRTESVEGAGNPVQGHWNGPPPWAGHAHNELGILRRQGACWVNDRVRVCAYKGSPMRHNMLSQLRFSRPNLEG